MCVTAANQPNFAPQFLSMEQQLAAWLLEEEGASHDTFAGGVSHWRAAVGNIMCAIEDNLKRAPQIAMGQPHLSVLHYVCSAQTIRGVGEFQWLTNIVI